MTTGTHYTPRISFDVTPELRDKASNYISWGSMRPLLTSLLEDVIDFIDRVGYENRTVIVSALITKKLSIIEVLQKTEDKKE